MRHAHLAMILLVGALAACSTTERDTKPLRDLRSNSGEPEEFSILPAKPLEMPQSFSALPQPTPGAGNRTDLTPKADAVAALGGNPSRLQPGQGIGAGDAALVQQASRFGRDEQIRATLAQEDEEFRRRKGRFSWSIVPDDDYNRAYRQQRLDPYRWLNGSRRAGAVTPAAPPEG